jgi:hypothetical protein
MVWSSETMVPEKKKMNLEGAKVPADFEFTGEF